MTQYWALYEDITQSESPCTVFKTLAWLRSRTFLKGTDVQLGRVFRGREIPRRIMSVRQVAAVRSWRFVLDAVFDPSRCASLDAASID